jgi:hypothetical protein
MASTPAPPRSDAPAPSAPWLEELDILIRARYPLLYLVSWEEHRVDTLLTDMARAHGKALLTWSITRGLRHVGSWRRRCRSSTCRCRASTSRSTC